MATSTSQFPAHAALFTANLIYGINYSLAKDVMGGGYIEASGFILLRALGAFSVFWLVSLIVGPRERVSRKDLLRLAGSAVFGVALNQLLFFNGLDLTTPINASIIMTMNPILVLIIASIVLRERLSTRKMLGVALGLSGALVLILFATQASNEPGFSDQTAWGDLMVLINAASYGVYLVLVKPIMAKYKALTVVKWVFTFGVFLVLPFGYEQFARVSWSTLPGFIWGEIAFVVIGTTVFAYLLNIYALKKVSPSVVSMYIYSQPVLATLFAVLAGKDALEWLHLVAASGIFTGVYLVSVRAKRSKA